MAAKPAAAQQGTVSFAFEGTSIRLQLLTGGMPGSVQVVDGDPAAVTLTDRSGRGGAALRLEGEVLQVENRSGSQADYRIAIPLDASVSLSVDGRTVLAVAPAGGGRQLSWRWPGDEVRVAAPAPMLPRREARPRRSFRVNAFIGVLDLDSAGVAHLDRVRVLKVVRSRGKGIAVSGDRSVRFGYLRERNWGVVVPRLEDTEVTLELPATIAQFKLLTDDGVIWEVRDGRAGARCEPVAEIRDRFGRDVWVFTPLDGHLECPTDGGTRSVRVVAAAAAQSWKPPGLAVTW